MSPNSTKPGKGFVFLHYLPWLILCLGFAITYISQEVAQQHANDVLQREFNFRFNKIIIKIENRLSGYRSMLQGAAGLFAATHSMDRNGFREYVSALNLEHNYPGIQGVGYSLLVAPQDKNRHIEAIQREGFAHYAIRPEGKRNIYTAIVYLEPFDWRNQRAFGYDMYAEPIRRAAMSRARDENKEVVSGKVKLIQETGKDVQAGFLMYVPVYRNNIPHETLEQRRANLLGWIYSPFRIDDLMSGILGKQFGEVMEAFDLKIYDGGRASAEGLMYDTSKTKQSFAISPHSVFQSTRTINVGGRDWTITVSSLPGFESGLKSDRARFILVAGIAVSMLLAWVVWLLINGRSRALELAGRMTRELSESETRLKELFEHMSSGVAVFKAVPDDRNFIITAFNRAAERIDKVQREDLIGKNVLDVFPEAAECGLIEVLRRVWSSGVAEHFPISLHQDGRITGWRENQVYKLPDGSVVVIYDDVTERKQAELALQASEYQTQQLLDNLPAGVVVHEPDCSIRYINSVARAFFKSKSGTTSGRVIPEFVSRFLREDGSTMPADELPERKVLADGLLLKNYVVGVELNEGEEVRWALVNAYPDVDSNGAIRQVIVSFVDITSRKKTEISLTNLNRFYSVLSRVNEAIIRTSERDDLFEKICRITVEDGEYIMAWIGMVDEDKGEIFPVACWGHEVGYLNYLQSVGVLGFNGPTGQAIKNGEFRISQNVAADCNMAPWRQEMLVRGYHSSAAFPFRLGDKVVGAIALYASQPDAFDADVVNLLNDLSADISFALGALNQQERRQAAEERLRQLNEELEQRVMERTGQLEAANKELEAFSYSVSHDLRAPLRSIDGFSELLEKGYAERLDATGRHYLGRVRRASNRMGELIDDLLELARVTRAELRKESVDLSRLVQIMSREMQEAVPQRQVEWHIQDGIVIQADSRLIKVVLENLLGNAWKFTTYQTTPRIEFGMIERENEKIIFIRDNGAGFDIQYVSKLFGAFQRLHKADEFEGTGIGLATVQRIIHRHGGRVWAEGQTGVGATFYFAIEKQVMGRSRC